MKPPSRASKSPWTLALVAFWWSLPFGLVEGLRTALEGATYNSLYTEDLWLRSFAVVALVVLIDGLLVVTVSLSAGLVARAFDRWSPLPWPRAQELAVAVLLQLALVTLLMQWAQRPPTPAMTLACMAGWAMFFLWQAQCHAEIRRGLGRLALAGAFFSAQLAFFACYRLLGVELVVTFSKVELVLVSGLGGFLTWLFRARPLPAIGSGLLILAGIALWGMALPTVRGAEPGEEGEGFPVLLITVDTLRQDALSSYGSERISTPNLDRLAEDGVLFERAYAAAPWTEPSIFSLLTSRYPQEHPDTRERRCGEDLPTLPTFLSRRMPSRAVLTNPLFVGYSGAWRCFDAVDAGDFDGLARQAIEGTALATLAARRPALPLLKGMVPAEKVSDRALRHLEILKGSGFFLWLHYFDPHSPYDPPTSGNPQKEEVRKVLGDQPYSWHTRELRGGRKTSQRERQLLRSQYDGEVRYTDFEIGRVLDFLVAEGLWDRSLIAFTSDHGEEFWEHGLSGHGHTVYEELIRVPLLIKFPHEAYRGLRIEEPVSLMDLLPTYLDYLGYPEPPDGSIRGRSLLPLLRAEPWKPRPLYFEGLLFYGERKALLEWPWKLIYESASDRVELYQIALDPLEQTNRAAEEAPRVERMLRSIEEVLGADFDGRSSPLDETERQRLKALGYLP